MSHPDRDRSGQPGADRDRTALLSAPGAPFEVARDEATGALTYVSGPRTLREFAETVWAYRDRPFLVAETGTYTYGEFLAAASALAVRFTDGYGLRPGDRAVIAMRNHPEWQIAFWATQLAGLVAVPLNGWWTEAEFAYALDDCTPRLLLVDGERLPRVRGWVERRNAQAEKGSQGGGPDAHVTAARVVTFHHHREDDIERYEDFPPADPLTAPPAVEVRPEDDATILYTSGTTGRPKGAVATHLAQCGAVANSLYVAAAQAIDKGETPGGGPVPVQLITFPFFHVAAFTGVFACMSRGGVLVMLHKWDPAKALAAIREHGVTHFGGVPSTALQLLSAARESGDDLGGLVGIGIGGAAAPPGLVTRLTAAHGERIEPRNGYGLTETCGGVLAVYGAEYRAHPDAVGRPAPAVEVRLDAHGSRDGEEVGELLLRGQSLIRGYWGDDKATEAAFTDDGWFRTGDLAVVRDGRVSVIDRLKDMVLRGGENVYCVEVESVLHDHPDVLDAAVVGVPHPVLGEEVAAVVQLRDGAAVGEDGLRAHVGASLAAFKIPSVVVLRDDELPRNPTGKILKRRIREELLARG
ncbi:class I adenylate-forming enzyme family protein [Streptomyces sp. NPDC060194]|uniref:class I adenylate-forming enzyme family protein n=1 Tax=Streptomyces sp. NPDC060194 TaxID=3347069 RepID=UPI00364B2132